MKRCIKCLMPETKPDIWFDKKGVCSACLNYEERKKIDWNNRKDELKKIIKKYKTDSYYDCVIPVSGGKDSHFQVLTMLDLGMTPLLVNAKTDNLSDLGQKNLNNLNKLGCDMIQVSLNTEVRNKISRLCLETVGDISWAEHVTIFTIPIRIAIQFNIPLIIWGENPQNEYGGPKAASGTSILGKEWLQEFGGLLGMRVDDLGFTKKQLLAYTYPEDDELDRAGITGLFLGYYLPWDGAKNSEIAISRGMKIYEKRVEGTCKNYENLDNYQTGIHDFFKYLKYGYGRCTDLICMDIRRGKITRKEAIQIVKKYDGEFPSTYLGRTLETILAPLSLTLRDFEDICRKHLNPDIINKDTFKLREEIK